MAETIEEYKRRRGKPQGLAEHAERFRSNLLGTWTNSIEFGPWPTDTWEFHPDGTGILLAESGSGRCMTMFEWREYAPYTILTRDTEVQADHTLESDDDADEDPDEDSEDAWLDRRWIERAYAFQVIHSFVPMVVMYWRGWPPSHDGRPDDRCFAYTEWTIAGTR